MGPLAERMAAAFKRAEESIESGAAAAVLDRWVALSQAEHAEECTCRRGPADRRARLSELFVILVCSLLLEAEGKGRVEVVLRVSAEGDLRGGVHDAGTFESLSAMTSARSSCLATRAMAIRSHSPVTE